MPLVVLPLLALLLVFLSPATQYQTFAVQPDPGLMASPGYLVVASHNDSFRVPGAQQRDESLGNGGADAPDGWPHEPVALQCGLHHRAGVFAVVAEQAPSVPRFLHPLLRAPPVV